MPGGAGGVGGGSDRDSRDLVGWGVFSRGRRHLVFGMLDLNEERYLWKVVYNKISLNQFSY